MSELHVFRINDCDKVVAEDAADAWKVHYEATGLDSREEGWTDIVQLPDHSTLSICCYPSGRIAEEGNGEPVKRTCAEWVKREGRGFLCTSEW